jgi:hypothetical protein
MPVLAEAGRVWTRWHEPVTWFFAPRWVIFMGSGFAYCGYWRPGDRETGDRKTETGRPENGDRATVHLLLLFGVKNSIVSSLGFNIFACLDGKPQTGYFLTSYFESKRCNGILISSLCIFPGWS